MGANLTMTIISSLCSQFKADSQETPKNMIFRCQNSRSPLSIPSKLIGTRCNVDVYISKSNQATGFSICSRESCWERVLLVHTPWVFRLLHCCIVIVYISIVLEKRMFGRVDGWQGGGLCKHTISQLYWATKILKYKNTKLQKCTNVKIQKVEMLHVKDTMEFEQKSGKSKVVSNLLGHFNFFKWHHVICFDLPSKVQRSPHHQDEIKRRSVSSSSSSLSLSPPSLSLSSTQHHLCHHVYLKFSSTLKTKTQR